MNLSPSQLYSRGFANLDELQQTLREAIIEPRNDDWTIIVNICLQVAARDYGYDVANKLITKYKLLDEGWKKVHPDLGD